MLASPEEVLRFWFGEPAADVAGFMAKIKRWYDGGPAMDADIAARFAETAERGLAGDLGAWAATTRGRLAEILVLDQFPRSLFRNTARAFAGDERAARLTNDALDAGLDRELAPEERLFLLMPLLHAESTACQERAVVEIERLHREAPEALRHVYAMSVEQAHKYRDVIGRFGRFPHRNAACARVSSPAEMKFLEDWSRKQAPSGFKK